MNGIMDQRALRGLPNCAALYEMQPCLGCRTWCCRNLNNQLSKPNPPPLPWRQLHRKNPAQAIRFCTEKKTPSPQRRHFREQTSTRSIPNQIALLLVYLPAKGTAPGWPVGRHFLTIRVSARTVAALNIKVMSEMLLV